MDKDLEELLALLSAVAELVPPKREYQPPAHMILRARQARELHDVACPERERGGAGWMAYATDEQVGRAWRRRFGTPEEQARERERDTRADLAELEQLLKEVA